MIVLPAIDSIERSGSALRLNFVVPAGLRYFEGHFPEVSLLPGVVQIGWAMELARQHLAAPAGFRALSNVKFMRVIQPGAVVSLNLRMAEEGRELHFEYLCGEETCSSGRALFH